MAERWSPIREMLDIIFLHSANDKPKTRWNMEWKTNAKIFGVEAKKNSVFYLDLNTQQCWAAGSSVYHQTNKCRNIYILPPYFRNLGKDSIFFASKMELYC